LKIDIIVTKGAKECRQLGMDLDLILLKRKNLSINGHRPLLRERFDAISLRFEIVVLEVVKIRYKRQQQHR
jgi:hypothetical protein